MLSLPTIPVWPVKNRQMSIKVAQNDFSTKKNNDFDTNNVEDLCKIIVAKRFEKLPKVQ